MDKRIILRTLGTNGLNLCCRFYNPHMQHCCSMNKWNIHSECLTFYWVSMLGRYAGVWACPPQRGRPCGSRCLRSICHQMGRRLLGGWAWSGQKRRSLRTWVGGSWSRSGQTVSGCGRGRMCVAPLGWRRLISRSVSLLFSYIG